MKSEGKWRQLIDPRDGSTKWATCPLTKEEAIAENVGKYLPLGEACPKCGFVGSIAYVLSGLFGCCAIQESIAECNKAIRAGAPQDPGTAHEMGLDYYWQPAPHSACGHPGKTTLKGTCYVCEQDRQDRPRQKAIAAGATWYDPKPGDLCAKGHQARRRVSNGSCEQCEADAREAKAGVSKKRTPSAQIMADCPDMILSRSDAVTLGFKVYRTGKKCTNGHSGWRYITTGGCLDCKGG